MNSSLLDHCENFNKKFCSLLNITLQTTGDSKIAVYLRDIGILNGNAPTYLIEMLGPLLFSLKDEVRVTKYDTFIATDISQLPEVKDRANKEDIVHCVDKIKVVTKRYCGNDKPSQDLQKLLWDMCVCYALYERVKNSNIENAS